MNKAIFAAGLLALLICQLVIETMATDDEDEQSPLHALNKRSVYGYREPYYSGYGKGHHNRWYGYRTYRYGNKRRYYRKKGKPYYGNYGGK